jgi:hypothetical protein
MHVLLVHAVVVLLPLAVVVTAVGAFLPSFRRKFGLAIPALAFVAMGFVPLTTHEGEWLRARVPDSALVQRHAEMGDGATFLAGLVFLVAAARWYLDVAPEKNWPLPKLAARSFVAPLVGALAVVIGLGTIVQIYRIGDSGARAAWEGRIVPAHAVEGGN